MEHLINHREQIFIEGKTPNFPLEVLSYFSFPHPAYCKHSRNNPGFKVQRHLLFQAYSFTNVHFYFLRLYRHLWMIHSILDF